MTFIDDLSRYKHVHLINKFEAFDKSKVFKIKFEKQLGKIIKIVRFNKGGEYYGKHGDLRQEMGPFCRVSTNLWYKSPIYYIRNTSK